MRLCEAVLRLCWSCVGDNQLHPNGYAEGCAVVKGIGVVGRGICRVVKEIRRNVKGICQVVKGICCIVKVTVCNVFDMFRR